MRDNQCFIGRDVEAELSSQKVADCDGGDTDDDARGCVGGKGE